MLSEELSISSLKVAKRASRVGGFIVAYSYVLIGLQTLGLIGALVSIFNENKYKWYGKHYIDWSSVWLGWGISVAVWVTMCFVIAVLATVGIMSQSKAKSLEIQVEQAKA